MTRRNWKGYQPFTRQKWRVWIETLTVSGHQISIPIHPPEMAGVD